MTDPLRITLDVACPADHAFALWTARIGAWWPSDHTVTGGAGLSINLESGVGGRIYERTADGVEHDWGVVTVWEPPTRLAYSWHLGRDASNATEVDIHFAALLVDRTRIEIEHRGWERLGDAASTWRDRNRTGWGTLLPHFAAAVTIGDR